MNLNANQSLIKKNNSKTNKPNFFFLSLIEIFTFNNFTMTSLVFVCLLKSIINKINLLKVSY